MVCGCGVREYWFVIRQATSDDPERRKQYDSDAAFFAWQKRRMDNENVSWCSRAPVRLRTRWLGGSVICPVKGDPWLRSQRLFVILAQVLISMALSIQFYQSDLEACPETCANNTEMTKGTMANSSTVDSLFVSTKSDCQCKTAECECLPNGLKASLLTAAIALPIIGLLNISFGLLRKPLARDLRAKSGEQWEYLQRQHNAAQQAERQNHDENVPCCCRPLYRARRSCAVCICIQLRCFRQHCCRCRCFDGYDNVSNKTSGLEKEWTLPTRQGICVEEFVEEKVDVEDPKPASPVSPTSRLFSKPPEEIRVERRFAGELRRSLTAQYDMHQHEIAAALHTLMETTAKTGRSVVGISAGSSLDQVVERVQIVKLMNKVNQDKQNHTSNRATPISDRAVDYVMLMAGATAARPATFVVRDHHKLADALANWKTLRHQVTFC